MVAKDGATIVRKIAFVNLYGAILRESIGARLKEERDRLGFNQQEFAAIGGASKRSQIDWEQGRLVPNAEFLALVAAAGVDTLYILTGEHSSASMTTDEITLLAGYRGLPPRDKANLLGILDVISINSKSTLMR